MSLLDLLDLTNNLHDVVKSPASYKPMRTALFWTIMVLVAGFFVVFGWLYIHGRLR